MELMRQFTEQGTRLIQTETKPLRNKQIFTESFKLKYAFLVELSTNKLNAPSIFD